MVLGGHFVPGAHVEEREVRVDELLVRPHLLGLVPLGDGGGEVALAAIGHAERELGIEVRGVGGQHGAEAGDGGVVIALAESEHGVVELGLKVGQHRKER